jgi:hypothetical protein
VNKPDRPSDAPLESPQVATTGDGSRPAEAEPGTESVSLDEAIRNAAKLAIDVKDLRRAKALLDLLDEGARPSGAPVLALAPRSKS